MKKKILSLLLSLSMVVVPVLSYGADNTLSTDCQLSAETINVGDTLFADYKITDNPIGFNSLTGFVYFDPAVLEAVDIDYTEMPSDIIEYNNIPLFPSNVVSSRVNFVPKAQDYDYNGQADNKTNAGKLGILKFSGYNSASVDNYLQNYTSTGTVIRIKFKAVGAGSSDVSFDKFTGANLTKGTQTKLNVQSAHSTVLVNGSATDNGDESTTTTEATTETTTVRANTSNGGGGGGGGSSTRVTTTTTEVTTDATADDATETTTATVESSTESTTVQAVTFSDVPADYWGAKYINELASNKVVNGYSDGTFLPNNEVKRADFIIMLLKGIGVDVTKAPQSNFSDVENGAYYYNAVGLAKDLGIANGNGDGTFSPASNITRQDMMILAKKALVYKLGSDITVENTDNLKGFSDYEDISAYALESLSAMVKDGYVNGMDGNKIAPKATTTRVQAATVIYKIMNK